jgi:hypothetical protein
MKQEHNITEILHQLKQANANLEWDEAAILTAYEKLHADRSGIAIKILTVFGGFLASLAFLGFLAIAGLESETTMIILGLLFMAGSVWLNIVSDKLITDTTSISLYLIGITLLGIGLSKADVDENFIYLLFMIIAVAGVFLTQNYILSFINVLLFNGSLLALMLEHDSDNLVTIYTSLLAIALTYVYLNEAKLITSGKKVAKLYDPLRIGLIFSLLAGLVFTGVKDLIPISIYFILSSSVVMIALVLFGISKILPVLQITGVSVRVLIYAISLLILIPTSFSPAISGAILILLLGFLVNHKTAFVIGILSIIYFISQYYYDLDLTLLTKSILLFSSGVLFILFYFFTHKKLGSDEKI